MKRSIALLIAVMMIFGILASALPVYTNAESKKSSSEIKQEIKDWKEKKNHTEWCGFLFLVAEAGLEPTTSGL